MSIANEKIIVLVENGANVAELDFDAYSLREQIAKYTRAMIFAHQETNEKADISIEFELIINNQGKLVLLGGARHEYFHCIKVVVNRKDSNYVASINTTQINNREIGKNIKKQKVIPFTTNVKMDGLGYKVPAGVQTPGLVIFLIDISSSMAEKISPDFTRLDAVQQLLKRNIIRMVQRSTRGTNIAPRYNIAMYAYSSQVFDLLGGIKSINELANMGIPQLTTMDTTDTSSAFSAVKELLISELPKYSECPAPIILHVTNGEFNGVDPEPISQEICNISVNDGNVLLANIYLKHPPREDMFFSPDNAIWADEYEEKLFKMSSTFPETYRSIYADFGFHVSVGAKMYFRGYVPEILELLMPMSVATPITRG